MRDEWVGGWTVGLAALAQHHQDDGSASSAPRISCSGSLHRDYIRRFVLHPFRIYVCNFWGVLLAMANMGMGAPQSR